MADQKRTGRNLKVLVKMRFDENPKDTGIKFATPADASNSCKSKRISKPYARKIQILTVMEQRAKVMGKAEVVKLQKLLSSIKRRDKLAKINTHTRTKRNIILKTKD